VGDPIDEVAFTVEASSERTMLLAEICRRTTDDGSARSDKATTTDLLSWPTATASTSPHELGGSMR
jgi:hypothetical protein